MAGPASPDAGPDDSTVPALPTGWIAQWDSRKYYFVQISTGKSTWDRPTTAAPGAPTLSSTTTPANDSKSPYPHPNDNMGGGEPGKEGTRGMGDGQHGQSTDRAGGFGGMAMNALLGGNKQSSGHGGGGNNNMIGQLAGSLLGGGKQSHGGSSSHGGGGGPAGLVGSLASGLLGSGNKPHGQQQGGQQQHILRSTIDTSAAKLWWCFAFTTWI
ncbi:hypothetical protein EJ08DRAFT_70909 [Tothia fuscella]|uniref:WW domain-containing protein n=1 Tax=Tothia fuscella TaxID=1048955 RepID=A0A9P4NEJ6_9PEZI|nr:hypothetical protein EJ08DRAFT_70909 [Tothia fuscella]